MNGSSPRRPGPASDEVNMRARLRERALRLLDRRPYSRAALEARLLRTRGREPSPSPADVVAVVDELVAAGLVDDQALARQIAERRVAEHAEGPASLYARLRARGIPAGLARQTVEEAFAEIPPDELARRALERVWPRYAHLPRAVAARRALALLLRRGIPADAARRAVAHRAGMEGLETEPYNP